MVAGRAGGGGAMSASGALEVVVERGKDTSGMVAVNGSGTDYRMQPLPHEDLTFKIIGAAMRVHNRLGPGLKEAFYQRALTVELANAGLEFVAEQPIEISIDGNYTGQLYLDHFVDGKIIVEKKAVSHLLTNEEIAQVITYICATSSPVGLLINFGRERLEYKRILPPKQIELWRQRIRRYVWLPPDLRSVNPFSKSADSPSVNSHPGVSR
jgi:GxxExxY protein